MTRRNSFLAAAAAVAIGSIFGSTSHAAALISASGPAATYGQTTNFSAEGDYDYVSFIGGTLSSDKKSASHNEKSGLALFSDPAVFRGSTSSGATLNYGTVTAAQGNTIANSGDATGPANFNPSANDLYARADSVGDGITFTYTMPANTTQTLNVYVESFNAIGTLNITSAADGTLFDGTPTALASSDGTGTPGTGHGAGVYSLVLSNASATPDVLTFSWLDAGHAGTSSPSVGIQGVTVATPEPAGLAAAAAGGAALMVRRRRRHAK